MLGAVTALLSSFMLTAEFDDLTGAYRRHVPKNWQEKLSFARRICRPRLARGCGRREAHGRDVSDSDGGLFAAGVDYALLFALLTTFIDALPVFGTGTVLLPWSLLEFVRGNARRGVGFLLLYAAAALTRQALEPRLLGGQIGLPPAVTLAALYVGYRVMGVAGMIVFPLLSVFCCQIYRALMEKTPEGQNASSRARKALEPCELACSFGFFAV